MESPLSDLPSSPDDTDFTNPGMTPFEAYLSSQNNTHNDNSQNSNGNGRVYEIANDGKLKLKINLKGLGPIELKETTPQSGHDSAATLQTQRIGSTQPSAPPSQSALPPVAVQQPSLLYHDEPSSDVFSDDIDLDDIFEHEVINRKLSDTISTFITHTAFNVTIRLKPGYPPLTTDLHNPNVRKPKTLIKPKTPVKTRVKKRSKVPHSRFIHKMPLAVPTSTADQEDEDIMEKSIRLSLKDPVSGSRLVTPLRSKFCSHIECFDYDSFLAMHNLKPFKVGLKRYTPASPNVGDVDVLKLLEDTKRPMIKIADHNVNTAKFQLKSKQKMLKEKGKQLNELEWFCCPICNLEFNIKHFGDLYVVGEFVDLLLDLLYEPNQENIDAIEIDLHSGEFKWLSSESQEEQRESVETAEVVVLSDEEEDEAAPMQAPMPAPMQAPMSIAELTNPSTVTPIRVESPFAHADEQIDLQTEREMYKQIDALFESEGIVGNTFVPQMRKPNGGALAGVVGFRPGAFVESEPEPVFMTGEGGVDDPIVLD